jgi:hypothetical protein
LKPVQALRCLIREEQQQQLWWWWWWWSLSFSLSLSLAPQPSLGLGLLHKIRLNFLEDSQQFYFLQGRVVSLTPNPHPGGVIIVKGVKERENLWVMRLSVNWILEDYTKLSECTSFWSI